MIEILILILSTLVAGGDVCALGTPVDYATRSTSPDLFVHSSTLWIDVYADGVVYIDLDGVEGLDGHPHGECAILIKSTY